MIHLRDKVVVTTGGKGLLGTALVKHVREAGAVSICADIRCEQGESGEEMHLDIANEESVRHCVATVLKQHGRIDGWINNAYPRTEDWELPFEDVPFESLKENLHAHLGGYFLCCEIVLEQLRKQKSGSLVNLASIYGIRAPDFRNYEGTDMTSPAAYSAIKGGIVNLSRYLASYYGPSGVRVNSLSPGGICNDQDKKFVERYESKTPLRRMATPDDIAPAAVFLLSDSARYITGHNLVVDGGWTAL